MSKVQEDRRAMTVASFRKAKDEGRKFSCITCYDGAFAKLIEGSPVDLVLVGDSMGNVILGYDSTIPVTVDHVVHHTAAVSRVLRRPFLVADMPFMSYATVPDALRNGARCLQEGGAKAVKLEGCEGVLPQIEALVRNGIPVMGHLGLQPQSVHTTGGYKIMGRGAAGKRMLEDAKRLEGAGAFSLVLEMVPKDLAAEITAAVGIPTIGIGAGAGTDGQILVLHDMLGFDPDFSPKFLKKFADLSGVIGEALASYDREVKEGTYPADAHSFE